MSQKIVAKFGNADKGMHTKTLVVYQMKSGLKGVVYKSTQRGWLQPSNVLMSAKFYEKDGDATLYRVCEYFGFNVTKRL